MRSVCCFLNEPAATEIYTLALHDALPISFGQRLEVVAHGADVAAADRAGQPPVAAPQPVVQGGGEQRRQDARRDRKSTRLNSSHANISYAVFCLKKKNISLNSSPTRTLKT